MPGALSQPTTNVPIVLGAMTFGEEGKEQARVHDLETVNEIIDIFQKHGHNEIDTARVYGGGTSEEYLGRIDWEGRGIVMDTKFSPNKGYGGHDPAGLRKALLQSLKALGTNKVAMWYLHAPDRTVPYETTMRGVNDLYNEGYFDRFGISNYRADEVDDIMAICEKNGFIKPSVYQGVYNAIHRSVEPELFPILRKHSIGFYAFNPLGGGFFAGGISSENDTVSPGSRFDPNRIQGQSYRKRYWNTHYFAALDHLRPVAEAHGLALAEVALRWMTHHSLLRKDHGDAILIGASSVRHIEQNLLDFEKGPLPDDMVKALDEAWEMVKPNAGHYSH